MIMNNGIIGIVIVLLWFTIMWFFGDNLSSSNTGCKIKPPQKKSKPQIESAPQSKNKKN